MTVGRYCSPNAVIAGAEVVEAEEEAAEVVAAEGEVVAEEDVPQAVAVVLVAPVAEEAVGDVLPRRSDPVVVVVAAAVVVHRLRPFVREVVAVAAQLLQFAQEAEEAVPRPRPFVLRASILHERHVLIHRVPRGSTPLGWTDLPASIRRESIAHLELIPREWIVARESILRGQIARRGLTRQGTIAARVLRNLATTTARATEIDRGSTMFRTEPRARIVRGIGPLATTPPSATVIAVRETLAKRCGLRSLIGMAVVRDAITTTVLKAGIGIGRKSETAFLAKTDQDVTVTGRTISAIESIVKGAIPSICEIVMMFAI